MSNKEHEKLAREAAEEIGHTTEHLLWRRTQIILAAIEKATAQPKRSVLADVPDCKCVQQGYPEPDCKWHGMEPQEWTFETVNKLIEDAESVSEYPGDRIADAHNAAIKSERERANDFGEQLESYVLTVTRLEKQLADERERVLLEASQDRTATGHASKVERIALELKQQLAAEREKVKRLVEALKLARKWMPNSRCPTVNEETACEFIDGVLARVKEIK